MNFLSKNVFPFICSLYLSLLIGGGVDATRKQYLILFIFLFLIAKFFLTIFHRKWLEGKKAGNTALFSGLVTGAIMLLAADKSLVPKFHTMARAAVSITTLPEKNPASQGFEVWLLGIKNGTSNFDINQINPAAGWERKEDKLLSFQNQPATLTITIEKAENPVLRFLSHPWSGKIQIKDGDRLTAVDLYKSGENGEFQYVIQNLKSYVSREDYLKLIAYSIISFAFFFIIGWALTIIIRQSPGYYFLVNLLFWILLFVLPSKLALSSSQVLMLLVLTLLAGIWTSKAIDKSVGYFAIRPGIKSNVLLSAIVLFASFACVGNTLFLSPSEPFNLHNLGFFILFAGWFYSVALFFLQLTHALKNQLRQFSAEESTLQKSSNIQFWGLVFLILTTIWLVFLFAFYPAVLTSESLNVWAQSLKQIPLSGEHTVFYPLFIRGLMLAGKNPAIIALFQILLMAAVVSSFITFLARKGVPKKWLVLFTCAFALIPSNAIYVITIGREVLFAIVLLWLTYLFVRLVSDSNYLKTSKWAIAGIIVALTTASLLRINGLVLYAVAGIGLLIQYIKFRNRSVLACLVVSAILITVFKLYWPDKKLVKVNPERYHTTSLKAYFQHPYGTVRERLQHLDILWNVSYPTVVSPVYYATDIPGNNFALVQKDNALRAPLKKYLNISETVGQELTWRAGIFNILLLLLGFYVLRAGWKRQLLLFIPWLAGIVALWSSNLGQEFSYVYFIPLIFWFVWATVVSPVTGRK